MTKPFGKENVYEDKTNPLIDGVSLDYIEPFVTHFFKTQTFTNYKSAIDVLSLIQDINRTFNTTILIITHNASISAMANKVYKFRSGEVSDFIINNNPVDAREVKW